ncbi:hypothetical protein Tco_1209334 [Tanacetum coccineum]
MWPLWYIYGVLAVGALAGFLKGFWAYEAEVPQDETEHEESVPTPSNDPQPSSEDSMQLTNLMVLCTKLQTQVLDLEKANDAQAKEIAALKKRFQRLERKKKSRPIGMKRLKKVGMSRRVESSEDQESLEVLDTDEMSVEAKVGEKDKQSTTLGDSTAGEAVTTASVEGGVASTNDKGITLLRTYFDQEEDKVVICCYNNTTYKDPQESPIKRREELTDEEKEKTIYETDGEKKEKNFAALRAQEKRNEPPTKAQKRTQMSTYLKHIGGYTCKQLKGKSFDEIQKLFDKEIKGVSEEKTKASRKKMLGRKRAGKEQQQESSKKQRIEEDKELYEVEEDDEAELKKYLLDKSRWKLMGKIFVIDLECFRGFDKEIDLKVMFEPDIRSDVWRNLQGYRVSIWKLIDSSGVHFVSAAGEKVYAAELQLLKDFLLSRG